MQPAVQYPPCLSSRWHNSMLFTLTRKTLAPRMAGFTTPPATMVFQASGQSVPCSAIAIQPEGKVSHWLRLHNRTMPLKTPSLPVDCLAHTHRTATRRCVGAIRICPEKSVVASFSSQLAMPCASHCLPSILR